MRLIDADALIGPIKLQEESYRRCGAIERAEAYINCLWEIEHAPTIGGWTSVKEQEPIRPIAKKEMDEITSYLETVYYCGNCHAYLPLYKEYNVFCVKCGRKINWNDQ